MLPALVCPTCRRAEGGDLHVRTLPSIGVRHGLLRCSCGATFPVVDGIPVLFRDVERYLAEESPALLRRDDLPDDLAELLHERAPAPIGRDAPTLTAYRRSQEGELQSWLRARCAALGPRVLEVGSGPGVTARADVVALDHAFTLLRAHPSPVRVCADAADPPFLPESFDAVVLANVLDVCADPGLVLAQADALLVPGGTLVVTCAFAFPSSTVPRARRFTADALRSALLDGGPLGGWSLRPHTLVEASPALRWPLRTGDRSTHTYEVDAYVTRKGA